MYLDLAIDRVKCSLLAIIKQCNYKYILLRYFEIKK